MIRASKVVALLVGLALLPVGCAAGQELAQQDLQRGLEAYRQGDVLLAYRLLQSPSLKEINLPPGFGETLQKVTEATEYLIERWLEKAGQALAHGEIQNALRYYSDLLQALPPGDPLRDRFAVMVHQVEVKLVEFRQQQQLLLADGRQAFREGRYAEARSKLEQAKTLATRAKLPIEMEHERLLEEAIRRLPPEAAAEPTASTQQEAVEVHGHHHKPAPSPPGHAATDSSTRRPASTAAETQPPPVDQNEEAVRSLLARAREHAEHGNTFDAIVTLRQVLSLAHGHPEAGELLKKLEPARQHLVADLLKQANACFAREELEKAVPFYRQILLIEPDNLRAKEGLQMYLQLQKLKEKQQ